MLICSDQIESKLIVPRWRGKYFNLRQKTNWGGPKLYRITIVQVRDATKAK